MTDIKAGRFQLDSGLDLACDGYTADLASSAAFLAADEADTITLQAGFTDPSTGTAYTVGHLVGDIKEYELTITPDAITGRVAGRDWMVELRNRTVKMQYRRYLPTWDEAVALKDAGVTYKIGTFRASEIAREVVEVCGLTLSWECRDYTLVQDFDAVGRPLDVLRKLIEPWSQVEPLQVDLFIQGTVVICRPRSLTPTPDYTFSIHDARIKSLTIRKRRARRFGDVELYGKPIATGYVDGSPTEAEEIIPVSEAKDESGAVLQRVVKIITYRMPERTVIRAREQTYSRSSGGSLEMVKEEDTKNEWEAVRYDDRGALNQPKQISQETTISSNNLNGKAIPYQPISQHYVSFDYDSEGYQSLALTRKWALDQRKNGLVENERVTRTLKDVSNLEVEEVTSVEKPTKSGGWYEAQRDVNKSAGVRPKGPRPGRTLGGAAGVPTKLIQTLSTHIWAEDVQYSNPNLSAEDLAFIMAQFAAASGLWEYELTLTYLAMPWIRKGNVLSLTGLLAEDGTPIPLEPALVVQQTLNYDEASSSPSMLSQIRAMCWSGTPS